jgi:hypothetical protein
LPISRSPTASSTTIGLKGPSRSIPEWIPDGLRAPRFPIPRRRSRKAPGHVIVLDGTVGTGQAHGAPRTSPLAAAASAASTAPPTRARLPHAARARKA